MDKLSSIIRNFKLPARKEIESAFTTFSKKEWTAFAALGLLLLFSTLAILESINKSFMVSIPAYGGEISEGIVGTPRFVNPVLAFSDSDRDTTALIYSGLLRKSAEGLIPDLAERYEISKDGLAYTFVLRDKIYFHDGKPVTPEDVIFTVAKVKDPIIKSPRASGWDGVTAEKLDERTVKFTLKQPYASFLENTTLGILPEHIWAASPIELNNANTNPIGTGAYKISKVNKESSGIITSFELSAFKKFSLKSPYLKKITLNFYPSESELSKALERGAIDQASSLSPSLALTLEGRDYTIESSVLPRIFGLFFNQNQNQLFTDKNIIRAINLAVDKDRIVNTVLGGYGIAIDGPIPPNMIAYQKITQENNTTRTEEIRKAEELLAKAGWKKNAEGFLEKTKTDKKKKTVSTLLTFSISTGNAPELHETGEMIKEDLAAVGISVEVKTYEIGNLNQGVIRPRKYDVLLFGQIINHEGDLYAFWHSSQRKDPGLNIAIYTNAKVDKILEDAATTIDEKERIKKYSQFEEEIKKDMPAVFLWSPKFIYAVSPTLRGLELGHVTTPEDRFMGIYQWYTKTDNVWKIFLKNK